jgi:hypothetical protein
MTFPLRPALAGAPSPPEHLRARLRESEDDHDVIRRAISCGVSSAALASDLDRWERLGAAVAALACDVVMQCAASAFCGARPDADLVTARLSESIDDLLDEPAWTVVDAAARLAVCELLR